MGAGHWLVPDGAEPSLRTLLDLVPDARDRLDELVAELWRPGRCDPVLLELCRLRVAQLCGDDAALAERSPAASAAGFSDDDADAVAGWPTSPRLDAAARACLAFTELFVVDPHAVTDENCAELRRHLGDAGATGLTMAVATFDALSRVRVALGARS